MENLPAVIIAKHPTNNPKSRCSIIIIVWMVGVTRLVGKNVRKSKPRRIFRGQIALYRVLDKAVKRIYIDT